MTRKTPRTRSTNEPLKRIREYKGRPKSNPIAKFAHEEAKTKPVIKRLDRGRT